MAEVVFGPWSQDPPVNRWDEFKIAPLEKWFDLISSSLNINGSSNEICAPPPIKQQFETKNRNKSRQKAPSPPSNKRATVKKVSPQICRVESDSSIAKEAEPPVFSTVQKVHRETWDDPHSFETFLSSPSYQLQPWPESVQALDESIGIVQTFFAPRANQNSERSGSRIPKPRVRH